MRLFSNELIVRWCRSPCAQVNSSYWGYAPDEALTNTDLIREKYAGIRPSDISGSFPETGRCCCSRNSLGMINLTEKPVKRESALDMRVVHS